MTDSQQDEALGEPIICEVLAGESAGQQVQESYTGWTEAAVRRSLGQASATFELSLAGRASVALRPGLAVRLVWEGQAVAEGYIDEIDGELGPRRTYSVKGRERTEDLVDCSHGGTPTEWYGLHLGQLANVLAEPFEIEVVLLTDPGPPFERWTMQHGESPWASIARASRIRGLLPWSDGSGRLLIGRPGERRVPQTILQGEAGTVISSNLRYSHADRYRTYVVRAQRRGTDDGWGALAAQIEGRAEDQGVQRHRPLVIVGESHMTFGDAQDRAEWEAAVRAARSASISVQLPGWRMGRGLGFWPIGELVPVRLPYWDVDTELLIDSVLMRRSRALGTKTELTLVRPDAYRPSPVLEREPDVFERFMRGGEG